MTVKSFIKKTVAVLPLLAGGITSAFAQNELDTSKMPAATNLTNPKITQTTFNGTHTLHYPTVVKKDGTSSDVHLIVRDKNKNGIAEEDEIESAIVRTEKEVTLADGTKATMIELYDSAVDVGTYHEKNIVGEKRILFRNQKDEMVGVQDQKIDYAPDAIMAKAKGILGFGKKSP